MKAIEVDAVLPQMMPTRQVAAAWYTRPQTVERRCRRGQVPGAVKVAGKWLVPRTTTVVAALGGETTLAEKRRELLGDDSIEHIRTLVAAAPPLTEQQRDAIRAAFAGGDA